MNVGGRFDAPEMSEWFWDIVHRAGKEPTKLNDILLGLSTNDVYRFALEFMLAASFVRGESIVQHLDYRSEDHVEDMSYWVVSQGKEFYNAVCGHPESVAVYTGEDEQSQNSLQGVAEHILDERVDYDVWGALNDDLIKYFDSGYSRISDYWDARQARNE